MRKFLLLLLFTLPSFAAAKVSGVTPVKYFSVSLCEEGQSCGKALRPFYVLTGLDGKRFYLPAF